MPERHFFLANLTGAKPSYGLSEYDTINERRNLPLSTCSDSARSPDHGETRVIAHFLNESKRKTQCDYLWSSSIWC